MAWRLRHRSKGRCADIQRRFEAKHCSSLCSQSEGGEYYGDQARAKNPTRSRPEALTMFATCSWPSLCEQSELQCWRRNKRLCGPARAESPTSLQPRATPWVPCPHSLRPVRAKVKVNSLSILLPLQGVGVYVLIPRALPWAENWLPFQGAPFRALFVYHVRHRRKRPRADIQRRFEAKHCSSLCSQSEGGEYYGDQARAKNPTRSRPEALTMFATCSWPSLCEQSELQCWRRNRRLCGPVQISAARALPLTFDISILNTPSYASLLFVKTIITPAVPNKKSSIRGRKQHYLRPRVELPPAASSTNGGRG